LAGILEKIISDKRAEVKHKRSEQDLESLKEQIRSLPKCRNFYRAVTKANRQRGFNIIAEVKKASPSAGIIRPNFEPVEIAQTYERCGANAVSVLTDEKYFQGKLEYIKQIKERIELPILRKDFIVDLWQVYESRLAGADAILLIAEALKPGELIDLMIAAAEVSLTVLLEVHQADTILAVRSIIGFPKKGYSILGINNRDLNTMEVDINTTTRLAELIEDKNELVAESGIRTKDDILKLKNAGVKAFLVGEILCRSDNIEEKFRELFG